MPAVPPPVPHPVVLSFAASDPTGGAGVQADLMTLSALACHALSVLTAVTAQDTAGIDGVLPVAPDWVDRQARVLLADIAVDAFKIGLLGSRENVEVVAAILADYPGVPVVFDPVLASGRGDALANAAMIAAMREALLPRTTLLTPNSLEARRLADDGRGAESLPLAECAHRLIALGCGQVLLTGTHEDTPQVENALYDSAGLVRSDRWPRLPGSYHGSGCTIASAVAAYLARGHSLADAVGQAQDYTWHALAAGFLPGHGQYIPDRFYRMKSAGGNDHD
jgi:hydroxymethylpyrimidine/phosphomethylpyrimidine kinase